MSLTSTLSNVIIKNNIVSNGAQTPDGSNSALTTLTYNTILSSSADCEIFGNTFSGIVASGNMLSLSGSHKISQNNFIRAATTINSYINYTGSNDCMIVDNFFDGYTVDGTSENLVLGLTANSIYERNKNQTGFTSVGINPYLKQTTNYDPYNANTLTNKVVSDTFDDSTFIAGLETTTFMNFSLSATTIGANAKLDLNTILPTNVKILFTIFGFYVQAPNFINTSSTSTFSMHMIAGLSSNTLFASPTGSLADAHYQLVTSGGDGVNFTSQLSATPLTIASGPNLTTFEANTQYLKIDVLNSGKDTYYITDKNTPIWLNIIFLVASAASANATPIYDGHGVFGAIYVPTTLISSPLVIKYRW
jgi:hypothetical protein